MVHRYAHVLIALAAGCGDNLSPDTGVVEAHRLVMPPAMLEPAEEVIRCSYHVLPDLGAIERVSYYATAPVHSFSIDIDPLAGPLDGTTDDTCAVSDDAVTLLASGRQVGDLLLPADAPLALPGGVGVVLRVHFLNPEDEPNTGELIVDFQPAVEYPTTSGLLGATRMNFTVPLGASTQETRCRFPAGVGVHTLYPDARRLTYHTTIRDDAGELASTYDWEHPPASRFSPAYVPTGDLVARCSLVNPYGAVGEGGPTIDEERCGMSMLVVPSDGVASCLIP